MKNVKRGTLALLAILLFVSANIYFDIKVPAIVDLPSDLNRIAIIDRSQSENSVVNVLEKGLFSTITGKGDRVSKHCIEGLGDQLRKNPELEPVITGVVEKRKGTAVDFPDPIHWGEIDRLCKEFNVDGIAALEIFSRQYIDNVAEVKVGYRIYYPAQKMIIDEFQFFHGIQKGHAPGETPEQVVVNILDDDDALKRASYLAGTIYGKRVSPFWIRVERKYYKRSKRDPKMAEGARMMEVNDWDAAIDAFSQAIEHGKMKTKGRAAYNLAVVYEINSDLELALQAAQDAWGKYGNKTARDYVPVLKNRINEIEILKNQIEN